MKTKIYILTLFFLVAVNFAFSQWVQQYHETLSLHLMDVKFINQDTGWTCGGNGAILKTTNAGNNWNLQNSGITGKYLISICAVNANVVYMVGFFETIIKTTNGGTNWNIIKNGPSGTGHSYEGVFFINENTGWICGSGSLIFKTTNGGTTFDSVNIPVGYNFDIYFRNANEGLVCGEAASMYKTTNGGLNWTEIIVPVGTQAADFFRLSPVGYSIVYTQGTQINKIYKSTNFGSNWDSVARVPGADESYTVFFPNENTGWCAGTFGLMFKTTNGGYNWQPEVVPPINQAFIRSLYFYNNNTGWAVGGATKIFYTSNGGISFINKIHTGVPVDFKLYQNYPNPFNSTTLIEFDIHKIGNYYIEIFNMLGQSIQVFSYNKLTPGKYKISFKANNLSSGIYFYKISNSNSTITKSMLLIK
ncbi:MAG: T9SS type A sorting domain-containing protein [Ignavibacteriae bacterium]|nr:T9SS type A sorting domain-containing protein [Ignavibacteriota bacterium]